MEETTASKEELMDQAMTVHRRSIIVDGHCDTPYRLKRRSVHIEEPDPAAQVTLNSLQESGITASFFAAYVPPYYAGRGAAKFAHSLIDIIETEAARNKGLLELVTDSAGIRAVKAQGEIGLMIGVEGGHAIEDSLEILAGLYERGARYLTLTHVNTNNWADSSGGEARHGGLTAFGREVVAAMNGMGMIVDISHVADSTFYNALETSSVPVMASHSSCRALASHPRNLTDDMLRDLASQGGVCMINFFSAFINDDASRLMQQAGKRSRKRPSSEFEELPDDRIDWDTFVQWFGGLGAPSGYPGPGRRPYRSRRIRRRRAVRGHRIRLRWSSHAAQRIGKCILPSLPHCPPSPTGFPARRGRAHSRRKFHARFRGGRAGKTLNGTEVTHCLSVDQNCASESLPPQAACDEPAAHIRGRHHLASDAALDTSQFASAQVLVRVVPSERQRLLLMTIIIGVFCGLAAVAFHESIRIIENVLLDQAEAGSGHTGWSGSSEYPPLAV